MVNQTVPQRRNFTDKNVQCFVRIRAVHEDKNAMVVILLDLFAEGILEQVVAMVDDVTHPWFCG